MRGPMKELDAAGLFQPRDGLGHARRGHAQLTSGFRQRAEIDDRDEAPKLREGEFAVQHAVQAGFACPERQLCLAHRAGSRAPGRRADFAHALSMEIRMSVLTQRRKVMAISLLLLSGGGSPAISLAAQPIPGSPPA